MTDTDVDDLPVFPTDAPEVFSDRRATRALFAPTLARLAGVVEIDDADLGRATPCDGFDVGELRRHVLGWLQFFAAALADPDRTGDRLDPDAWELDPEDLPAAIVERSAAAIDAAIADGVAERLVVMSQARMAGDGALAMALGEYLVHGWDLARATGRPWDADDDAAGPALAFLRSTVAPEHRGPDSGFFDAEITPPEGATTFEQLLCFAGRHPDWTPPPGH